MFLDATPEALLRMGDDRCVDLFCSLDGAGCYRALCLRQYLFLFPHHGVGVFCAFPFTFGHRSRPLSNSTKARTCRKTSSSLMISLQNSANAIHDAGTELIRELEQLSREIPAANKGLLFADGGYLSSPVANR